MYSCGPPHMANHTTRGAPKTGWSVDNTQKTLSWEGRLYSLCIPSVYSYLHINVCVSIQISVSSRQNVSSYYTLSHSTLTTTQKPKLKPGNILINTNQHIKMIIWFSGMEWFFLSKSFVLVEILNDEVCCCLLSMLWFCFVFCFVLFVVNVVVLFCFLFCFVCCQCCGFVLFFVLFCFFI